MLSVSHFSCHFDSDLIGWLVSGDGKWEMCVEGKLITLETKSATEPQSHFSICQSVRNSLFAVAHLYSCGLLHVCTYEKYKIEYAKQILCTPDYAVEDHFRCFRNLGAVFLHGALSTAMTKRNSTF